jgi:acetyl esterase
MIISDQMNRVLDPAISRFASHLVSGAAVSQEALSLDEVRRRAIELRLPLNSGGPSMHRTEEHELPSADKRVPVRIYRPTATAEDVVFYFHGGGWTLLNLACFDRVMREYAAATGMCVVGVEYPAAPEHPYPTAIEATSSLLDGWAGNTVGLRHDRFAFAGDSAGANLALATALKRREERKSTPYAMILQYGVYDCDMSRPSYSAFGNGSLPLSVERMKWFWANYCPDPAVRSSPLVSPLRADLRGLPPVFMVIADHDILYDENLLMAEALKLAGVEVGMNVYPGTTHAFIEAISASELSRSAIHEASRWLRARIG